MNVRYRVDLSQSERDELVALVSGGKHPVRRLKRMQIYRTKKRFVEISLEGRPQ
jgi:hypothetical protein